eukprot:884233-Prymnesium_polylepis.1
MARMPLSSDEKARWVAPPASHRQLSAARWPPDQLTTETKPPAANATVSPVGARLTALMTSAPVGNVYSPVPVATSRSVSSFGSQHSATPASVASIQRPWHGMVAALSSCGSTSRTTSSFLLSKPYLIYCATCWPSGERAITWLGSAVCSAYTTLPSFRSKMVRAPPSLCAANSKASLSPASEKPATASVGDFSASFPVSGKVYAASLSFASVSRSTTRRPSSTDANVRPSGANERDEMWVLFLNRSVCREASLGASALVVSGASIPLPSSQPTARVRFVTDGPNATAVTARSNSSVRSNERLCTLCTISLLSSAPEAHNMASGEKQSSLTCWSCPVSLCGRAPSSSIKARSSDDAKPFSMRWRRIFSALEAIEARAPMASTPPRFQPFALPAGASSTSGSSTSRS